MPFFSVAAILPPAPRIDAKALIESKRRECDHRTTVARIEREMAQVRAMLLVGPVSTKQITAATGVSDNVARCRVREVGGVWDGKGRCWRLANLIR